MSEPVGVTNLRRGYKAFADNDIETLSEVIPENAVWHIPGRNRLAGEYRGRDAVFTYFRKLAQATGGTLNVELIHAAGDDEYTIAVHRTTATVNGHDVESFDVLLDRLENGEAVETWLWSGSPYEFDELFGR